MPLDPAANCSSTAPGTNTLTAAPPDTPVTALRKRLHPVTAGIMRLRHHLVPALLVTLYSTAGCGGETVAREARRDPVRQPQSQVRFQPDTIPLQETADVINVEPVVSVDGDQGFIVGDLIESQIRIYSRSGRLRNHFGRRGSGPGEFDGISAALRLESGAIAAVDTDGKIGIFSEDGELQSTQQTPLVPVYSAVVLDAEHLALAGRLEGKSDTDLVHIWSIPERRIVESFFPVPAHPEAFATAYSFSGFADVAARGDTIAAIFALTDSVFLFLRDGTRLGSIHIPASDYRPLATPMPAPATPLEEQQWMESFSTFADVFWTREGELIAQYFDLEKFQPKWHVAGLNRDGRLAFEHKGAKLIAISPEDSLFFIHPLSDTPNKWAVALVSR
jgi:hypothetical protein